MKFHASSKTRLAGVALLFTAALAGCGGSGSGSLPPPAAAPAPVAAPAPLVFSAFPSAVAVIGQEGFDQLAPVGSPGTLNIPVGEPAVTADGRLFVADFGTKTLKVFSRYDQHGPSVDFPGVADPRSVSIHSGRLVVIDGNNVRIFESATPGAAQLAVAGSAPVCSAAGLRAPSSAHLTPTGRLVVADAANNRVLIWNQVTPGQPLGDANVVLGQPSMIACEANGGGTSPSDSTLSGPSSVWSDGNRLIVADSGNHRVLVWDSLPTASFQPARTVLGQRNFTDALANAGGLNVRSAMSLDLPVAVDVNDAGQLAVMDQQNHRMLLWNRIPDAGAHGQPADQVIGQDGFTTDRASDLPSDRTLSNEPHGLRFHGTDLIVVDSENNRVLVWRGTAPPPVAPPPVVGAPPPALPFPTETTEPPGPGVGAY
ncbi:hypothetical protein [Ramlibacter sp. Leaf400]|uniref:hypothetical protein n=1 Tax=Ramlibacter sp. Leaf400 TaxID=1736365 RepID=UPI0006F34F31|nr:hypothetical protein [Ramlibacter sp. Leaf400]KQT11522.1 hypothetical protein ASG30_06530 [Ramlibacter sp. Leaf400]